MGGYVAQRSVQLGQHIAAGEPLMSIVPLQDVWLDANFKEGQLRNLRIGQPARIITDVYGSNVVYHGKIIGLSAGTGAAFSLLPPQNASGNWIKVVQRVPVKIALDQQELAEHPLRIGLSTTTTIDTHDRSGTVLATEPVSDVHENTAAYAQDMAAAAAAALKIVRLHSGRG
jgi:membrane fusion protein (multidrug efflux system)